MDKQTKLFIALRSAIIAGLVFIIWLHRHAPGTQAFLVSLIGVGVGAFLGAWLGHWYALKRDQEKAEHVRVEQKLKLTEFVSWILLSDSLAAEDLAQYTADESSRGYGECGFVCT